MNGCSLGHSGEIGMGMKESRRLGYLLNYFFSSRLIEVGKIEGHHKELKA